MRYLKPPPNILLGRFLKWWNRWTKDGWDMSSRKHIFTEDTMRLARRTIVGIQRWFMSDPWVQVNRQWLLVDMYHIGQRGKLFSKKESSLLESRWSQMNPLKGMTQPASRSEESQLPEMLLDHNTVKWNQPRMQKLGLMTTNGISDLGLLHRANEGTRKLDLPLPYPTVPDMGKLQPNPFEKDEAAGVLWKAGWEAAGEPTTQRAMRAQGEAAISIVLKRELKQPAAPAKKLVQTEEVPLPVVAWEQMPAQWRDCAPFGPDGQLVPAITTDPDALLQEYTHRLFYEVCW